MRPPRLLRFAILPVLAALPLSACVLPHRISAQTPAPAREVPSGSPAKTPQAPVPVALHSPLSTPAAAGLNPPAPVPNPRAATNAAAAAPTVGSPASDAASPQTAPPSKPASAPLTATGAASETAVAPVTTVPAKKPGTAASKPDTEGTPSPTMQTAASGNDTGPEADAKSANPSPRAARVAMSAADRAKPAPADSGRVASSATPAATPPQLASNASTGDTEPIPIRASPDAPRLRIPAHPAPPGLTGADRPGSNAMIAPAVTAGAATTPAVPPTAPSVPASPAPTSAPPSAVPSSITPAAPVGSAFVIAGLPLPNLPPLGRGQVSSGSGGDTTRRTGAAPADPDAAHILLDAVSARTGLTDGQAEKLALARSQVASGDTAGALSTLGELNHELDQDVRVYVVVPGDSLWSIAGFRDVYGNPKLWPLIWQANRALLPQPDGIHSHLQIVIPMHPRVAEITAALELARHSSVAAQHAADAPSGKAGPPAPAPVARSPAVPFMPASTTIAKAPDHPAPLPAEAAAVPASTPAPLQSEPPDAP